MALHNEKMRFAPGCGAIGKTGPSSLNPYALTPIFSFPTPALPLRAESAIYDSGNLYCATICLANSGT